MTVFLGTLWSSIKQIESPYMFDFKHGIALHAIKGNQASIRDKGKVSWVFLSCGRNLGYILELWWGSPFETRISSVKSGVLSSYDGHLRNLN